MNTLSLLFATFFALAAKPVPAIPRTEDWWRARHAQYVEQAKTARPEILFLGDSITDGWRGKGRETWERHYAPRQSLNFGIGGDGVEHVLWRVRHGELGNLDPRVVVVLIGTNNLDRHTAEQVVATHRDLVDELRARLPYAKILLIGIFARADRNAAPANAKIALINPRLEMMADGERIHYLDAGIPTSLMPDGLHLSKEGYEYWADAMEPVLSALSSLLGW
jgi:lysophospholipase L1-like esterase